MGNATGVATDAMNKAQDAAIKTANATTQAVSNVATMVGSNKAVAATTSTITTIASKAVSVPMEGAKAVVNNAIETEATFENKVTVDISHLYDCQLRFCKTELTKGNGTVYNTLEYLNLVPIKQNVNEMLEEKVNPMVEKNVKLIFNQISEQINIYNKQKDNFIITQIKTHATKIYGFDSQRHGPIVQAIRNVVSQLLDFKKVICCFENDYLVARLDNKNEFNQLMRQLENSVGGGGNNGNLGGAGLDLDKIKSWKCNHYFPIYFGNNQIYIDVNVGFKYENINVKIFKKRLFNVFEREIENTIDENWDIWMKNIKMQHKLNVKLQDSDISLHANPYSQSQVDFDNRIRVKISR